MSLRAANAVQKDRSSVSPSAERQRLVRLCAHITGDFATAEDLAQETLLEAHRHSGKLRNPAARQAWLSGIARNVCRRWARTRGRELSMVVLTDDQPSHGYAIETVRAVAKRLLGR